MEPKEIVYFNTPFPGVKFTKKQRREQRQRVYEEKLEEKAKLEVDRIAAEKNAAQLVTEAAAAYQVTQGQPMLGWNQTTVVLTRFKSYIQQLKNLKLQLSKHLVVAGKSTTNWNVISLTYEMGFGFKASVKAGQPGFAEQTHMLLDQLYVEPKLSAKYLHNDLCGYHTEFSKEAHELVGDCVWMIQQAQDFATGERTEVIRMQEMGCCFERQE